MPMRTRVAGKLETVCLKISTILLTVSIPLTSLAGPFKFNIVAKVGDPGLMGIHSQVSINDSNRVPFIGQETSDYTFYTSIWVADGNGTPPRRVNFGGPGLNYEYPQINNNNLIVARGRVS